MNDKDLEAFYKWVEIEFGEIQDHQRAYMYEKSIFRNACEYKQKEIEDLYKHLKHEHDLYRKHLKVYEDEILEYKEAARSEAEEVNRLQTENKKLREVLDFYADYNNWKFEDNSACVIYMDGEPYPSHINGRAIRGFEELRVSGKRAREVLKEITITTN
jgi:regulator of replication initiation timing